MRVDTFSYDLPPERIAQHPTEDREAARLLVIPPGDAPFEHRSVGDFASLLPHGVLIVGMPSLESQAHASPQSREGHVNCKSGRDFKALMERFFHNVFLFSMNDEVVHTGFYPMAHYLLAVCTTPRHTARAPAR